MTKEIVSLLLGLFIVFLMLGCEDTKYPEDIWNPDEELLPNPEVAFVVPSDSAYAGVGEIKIYGKNFNPDPERNYVHFGSESADVLNVSDTLIYYLDTVSVSYDTVSTEPLEIDTIYTTEIDTINTVLTVSPPNVVEDSLTIKIAVYGAFLFAEYHPYKLYPAIIEYGGFDPLEESFWGLTMDGDENLYVGLEKSPYGSIEKLLPPNGERISNFITTQYISKPYSIRIGQDNYIYYLDGITEAFLKIHIDTGDLGYAGLPGSAITLDFDENGNLYCGGGGEAIYCVKSDLTVTTVASYTDINIKALRVFQGYVYIAGNYTGSDTTMPQIGIWKNEILSSNGDLGEKDLVLDWSSSAGDNSNILAITFDEDGILYIAPDDGYAINMLTSENTLEPVYEKILSAPIYKLCWGNEEYLYINCQGEGKGIFRVWMGKKGAPRYGRSQ